MTPDAEAANPLVATASREVETAAIVIFAGRYYSGMPYEEPATIFLKVRALPQPITHQDAPPDRMHAVSDLIFAGQRS